MPKNKQPASKKSVASPEEQEEALTQDLGQLAGELAAAKDKKLAPATWKTRNSDFQKLIRKCLQQKKDDVLYEALDRAIYAGGKVYQLLKESIEEASEIQIFKREQAQDIEVNAFVIPIFAHTRGGLQSAHNFQDQQAFDLLTQSIQEAQLESRNARVVLVSHAYHLDEIDGIRYSHLYDMVRDAFTAMTSKKLVATPAIDRSIIGWPENHFSPQDLAVELRFLLGFTLKAIDDPFYHVPTDEEAAERYFDVRAARFQQWALQVAPLVKRCLATEGFELDIHFLYQDLFFGGKERGVAEYFMLEMMSELHQGLQLHGALPEHTHAVVGPADVGGELILRVNLHAHADRALLVSAEKTLPILFDLASEADDIYDALTTIGVKSMALAVKFDADGQAVDAQAYGV
jgi:hypothetical protein